MDGPFEQTAKADYGTVAAKQSPLTALLDSQEKTAHLLQVLSERLSPVANPTPTDKAALNGNGDCGYHIETAVYKQREINDAISYIIDSVVI